MTYYLMRNIKHVESAPVKSGINYRPYIQPEYKLTRPILLVDLFDEDSVFLGLKMSIQGLIEQEKAIGKLTSASIYVRNLGKGKWFSINPVEQYSPGSIMKMMILLTYMRMSESSPGLLDRTIVFEQHIDEGVNPTIIGKQLVSGRTYSVKELLRSMIVESNNDAAILLSQRKNDSIYVKLLKNLNMAVPLVGQQDYPIDVVQCSRFMRLLYASTFLTPEDSEFALELLSKSEFSQGITKSIPDSITVAHKFGERNSENGFQLHETGIVYLNNSPYLLTVMTKGSDQNTLKETLDEVSSLVYQYMSLQAQ